MSDRVVGFRLLAEGIPRSKRRPEVLARLPFELWILPARSNPLCDWGLAEVDEGEPVCKVTDESARAWPWFHAEMPGSRYIALKWGEVVE